VNDLPGSGGPHACVRLDVCDAVSVRAWADALRERLGGEPDLVVHCAGWGVFRKIVDTTEEEWDRTISTNVKGLFLVTREVLPAMLGRGSGHFVNVLSVTAKVAFPKNSAYCASKYGALGFTEALRAETRRHGIRVTAVFPGATDTPFWDRLEGEWDRTKMMPVAAVARAIREAAEAGPNAMVEEIHIGPQQGNL
jgi:NAD(P)-dependent dehydrogenase (short-subunit alcohol dehydrogenase family)